MVKILYSDKNLVACVKPVGVSSENELPELLSQQLSSEVFCVHRLDKQVGGVMIYARTKAAAGKLSTMIAERSVKKEYLAVVEGIPETRGTMEDLLFHDKTKNKSYVVKRMRKGVRDAKLEYIRRESSEELSLCHILLHTGRTHQIRVQFASRKLPLAGDARYGSRKYVCAPGLWSYRITFVHPFTKEPIAVSALPDPAIEPWDRFRLSEFQWEDYFGN